MIWRLPTIAVLAGALALAACASGREASSGEPREIGGRDAVLWRPAASPEHAPLVVFSHGFGGCPTQSVFLAEALADAGYAVVAPRHDDARCGLWRPQWPEASFYRPETWSDESYRGRAEDVSAVVAAMKDDLALADGIDFARIALVGHSLGGYTALGLAGGWPSWRLDGVAAVVALAPYCAPFNVHGGFATIDVPVAYQIGEDDRRIRSSFHREQSCWDSTKPPAHLVELADAGHGAFTDRPTGSHADIVRYAVAFLDEQLRGGDGAALAERTAGVVDLRSK